MVNTDCVMLGSRVTASQTFSHKTNAKKYECFDIKDMTKWFPREEWNLQHFHRSSNDDLMMELFFYFNKRMGLIWKAPTQLGASDPTTDVCPSDAPDDVRTAKCLLVNTVEDKPVWINQSTHTQVHQWKNIQGQVDFFQITASAVEIFGHKGRCQHECAFV